MNALKKGLQQIVFLILSLLLLYWAFKGQDLKSIWVAIENAHLWILIPVVGISFLGHIIRALRWQMLIQPLGYHPSFWNAFHTLMFGYLVNYAVPRFGEVVRCATLKQKENIPFSALFGTVMTERLIDVILLFASIAAAFLLEFNHIQHFFIHNVFSPVYHGIYSKFEKSPWILWVLIAGIGYGIYWLIQNKDKAKEKVESDETNQMVDDIWKGLMTFSNVPNKSLLVIYSLSIWVVYFFTTYLLFFAFDATAHLNLSTGLTIMVIGSLGRSVPVQGGGMGAYHYLVSQGLSLFGVPLLVGNAFAVVNHGTQALYQLMVGSASLLILLLTGKKISFQFSNVKDDQNA